MKRYIAAILTIVLLAGMAFSAAAEPADSTDVSEEVFAEWNLESPALNYLVDYVRSVTDEASPDFIPAADRIAVFDMDGTLYGELFPTYLETYILTWRILKDPGFQPDDEMLMFGRETVKSVMNNSYKNDYSQRYENMFAKAFAGMTLSEFSDFITEILLKDADGFEGMQYGNAFFIPMLEVIEYLQDNDFTVYVVSGSDRFICRTLLEGAVDIPYSNILGKDVAMEASGQNGEDGLYYVFSAGDDIQRTDRLITNNNKMNKVSQIVQEIGMKPVLSFGNSSGDVSMLNYTIYNNPYKSAAFMLIADDETRDYGNPGNARELKIKWKENGYQVISMKDDFLTIYGDEVTKTGSFHWSEVFSEDR